jgi:hypothetical protein
VDTNACPKERKLLCRDRILAALTHAHLLLEIRSGGNLASVLDDRQSKDPRLQFVFEPDRKTSANAGNFSLLEKYPEHAVRFRIPETPPSKQATATGDPDFAHDHPPEPDRIDWREYLFHYTRSCPEAWPGEAQIEYLLNLLAGQSLAGHSALDTLVRILQERRIRAGSRLVRGNEAVISWSSHSPREMFILRKWNSALVRWTVEPYGLAVRRDYLRVLGAKPVIYGPSEIYSRLAEPQKFRFQRSEATRSGWRHEREWRLNADLMLDNVGDGEGFIFVRTGDEKSIVLSLAAPALPVIAFNEIPNV